MTLHNKLLDFVKENHSDIKSSVLARRFIDRLPQNELLSILAEEIDHIRRFEVRSKEQLAFDDAILKKLKGKQEISMDEGDNFAVLMKENFSLGDGNIARWGEATTEQHAQRIVFLEKMRIGLNETISFHKQAIEIIKKNKVSCLNDVLVCV